MQLEEFLVIRILMFFFGSFLLLALSWRSLRNIRSHGFYRFFAFEIILILLLVNATFWFQSPHAVLQLISWFLLLLSIIFVSHGFYLLKKTGGLVKERAMHPENLNFENTTSLVTGGIFNYIRHPMYSSLILLAWGIFFKNVTFLSFLMTVVATFFLVVAAKREEKENISFFGTRYQEYMRTTKMFIPCLF